jgi:hypothetical protein
MHAKIIGLVLGGVMMACGSDGKTEFPAGVVEAPPPIDQQVPDEVQVAVFGLG